MCMDNNDLLDAGGDRVTLARELKRSGKCNCAQAVACAFADAIGADADMIWNSTAAFGSGMATMEGTCGAVTGAGVIIGLAASDRNAARVMMKDLITRFRSRNGATICRELKGIGTGTPLRACEDCVADSAEFLADILDSQK